MFTIMHVSFPVVWWIVFLPVMILYMMMVLMGIVLLVCSGDNENGKAINNYITHWMN